MSQGLEDSGRTNGINIADFANLNKKALLLMQKLIKMQMAMNNAEVHHQFR